MLRASMGAGVDLVLGAVGYPYREKGALSEAWAAGDKGARKSVDVILAKAGLTIEEAKTLEKKIDVFERIDRMLASAEARRNNALREIDRHRDALGGGVRRSIEEIEDAEFQDVETGEAAAGRNRDQRPTMARQSGQRKSEQGTEDQGRKGSLGSKRAAPWPKHSCFQGALTLNPGRGNSAQACRPRQR
jgi:hypothetical protein